MLFWIWTRVGHLVNTIELSMCRGDASCCQITLSTCSVLGSTFAVLGHCWLGDRKGERASDP